MRLVSAADWQELFESVSLVDEALRTRSNFAAMDFPTRDHYRRAIEELARGSHMSELEVAGRALDATEQVRSKSCGDPKTTIQRQEDPGYYLIAKGRSFFEHEIGFRAPAKDWLVRVSLYMGITGYLGTIAMICAIAVIVPLVTIVGPNASYAALMLFGLVALAPALDLAVAITNRQFTRWIPARPLPAMELRDGIPASLRTLIAIPTMLTTAADIERQVEQLEVHYLASEGGELYFALLSDWTDSSTESREGDAALLAVAMRAIARLNSVHKSGDAGDRFYLLHRRRLWNEGEAKWMGWERKRGKLHELNRLLRGASDISFLTVDGRLPGVPADVHYVITLDADTRLPRGTAARLVGKMAHPLNCPSLDPSSLRVTEGHAVLQPRVTPSLPGDREGSIFQRVFSGPSGIDPYAFIASDVYQDLLDEGSYNGKGIYDVDAFERSLDGRVPDNTLLSHDLFEGIFARAGFASDIELVEEFPSRYDVAAAREHRWARGDWQLLPWLVGRGRIPGDAQSTALPMVGRWKMIDNLRRSMSAPATFIALIAGWTLPTRAAALWSGLVLSTIAVPAFLPVFSGLLQIRSDISLRSHWRAFRADLKTAWWQFAFRSSFLAHQAWLMGDAIARTLFRLLVTHRRMLEWITAAQANLTERLDLLGFYRRLAGGVILALVAAVMVARMDHRAALMAMPFIVLWVLSPAIALWASLPPSVESANQISEAETSNPEDGGAADLAFL